jgi:hypothetical protein
MKGIWEGTRFKVDNICLRGCEYLGYALLGYDTVVS